MNPRFFGRAAFVVLISLHGGFAIAAAPQERPIAEIRVEGNELVARQDVLKAIAQKEGAPFEPGKTADDLRGLWTLGTFSDVQLLVEDMPSGGLVYVVRVTEAPTLRQVRLEGNREILREDLDDAITVKPFASLKEDSLRAVARKLRDAYVEKGYLRAEVSYRIEPLGGSRQVDVVFVIAEHQRAVVREVRFVGAQQVADSELEAVMQIRPARLRDLLTNGRTFTEDRIQRDVLAIQALYYDRGFVNARVEQSSSLSADGRSLWITIKIQEGDSFRLGKIELSGNSRIPERWLKPLIRSRTGATFNRSKLTSDISAVTEAYQDRGYAHALVAPLTALDADAKIINLTLDVTEGSQVTVERIEIAGNTVTPTELIRKEVKLKEGGLFSSSEIRATKEGLLALGLFDSVVASYVNGNDDAKVVVTFEVTEKAHSLSATLPLPDLGPWISNVGVGFLLVVLLALVGLGWAVTRARRRRRARHAVDASS
jgi:outer membrane protein insertion porin family